MYSSTCSHIFEKQYDATVCLILALRRSIFCAGQYPALSLLNDFLSSEEQGREREKTQLNRHFENQTSVIS